MNYDELLNEMVGLTLTEDVHDYLKKLAKKGIQKIGSADFKSILGKYGSAKEKQIFADTDTSAKSLDVNALFSGISKGIRSLVSKEREGHPYEIVGQEQHKQYFPAQVHIKDSRKKGADPVKLKSYLNFRRDLELNRLANSAEGRAYDEAKSVLQDLTNTFDTHTIKAYDIADAILSPHREALFKVKQPLFDKMYKAIEPVTKGLRQAERNRTNARNSIIDARNKGNLSYDDYVKQMGEANDKYSPAVEHYSKLYTQTRDYHEKQIKIALEPHERKLREMEKIADYHVREYKKKHGFDEFNDKFDAAYSAVDKTQDAVNLKQDEIFNKYQSLTSKVTARGLGTPIPFSNYKEHVAQSDLETPIVTTKNRAYGGGHWYHLPGTTEFNVITSDLDHPTLGKTLFVHEIQSDLQQKTKNDSPIGKTWREHAISHVHDLATKGGYEHVMFAPPSVQYVNNGGGATPAEINTALRRLNPEQKKAVRDEFGTDNSEDVHNLLQTKAGQLANRYETEILPAAARIFGHDPEHHAMNYKRERGQGEGEEHHFPVFKIQKNIDAVEEEFQEYLRHKQLVESITTSLLK